MADIIKAKKIGIMVSLEVSSIEYTINFTWDDEADVWIATSQDISGLVLESGSSGALLERIRFAVPE